MIFSKSYSSFKNFSFKNKWILITLLFIAISFSQVSAQTAKIESLKSQISNANGKKKLKLILDFCDQKNSMPGDSIYKYVLIGEVLNQNPIDRKIKFQLDYFKAGYWQQMGLLDSALNICDKNLAEIGQDTALSEIMLMYKSYKGVLLIRNNKYKEAIAMFFETLKIAEKQSNYLSQMSCLNGIGWANMELENYNEAITWFQKAEQIPVVINSYKIYPLSNMAATYNSLNRNDSAYYYIEKSIKIAEEAEDLKALANAYAIKSDILIYLKKTDEAEKTLMKAVEIRKKIGDDYYVVSDMQQLGIFYANTHQCEKGKAICDEGIALAMKKNLSSKLIILYEALAQNYKSCNDFQGYAGVLEKIISLKDSIQKRNTTEAIAEMQTKYEVGKKENIIIQQQYTLARRNYLYFGSLLAFIMVAVITFLIFNQYRLKQKSKESTSILKAKDDERRRIASELHDDIGAALGSISFYSEVAIKNLEQNNAESLKTVINRIGDTSREMVDSIGDIVWAVNPQHNNLEDLVQRMQHFGGTLCAAKNISLQFLTNDANHLIELSIVRRKNVFLIFKEAIHNILKYASCNQIKVIIKELNNTISITISDNGIGFIQGDKKVYNGNGLKNMQARADEIGATLNILSEINIGTSIEITFKLS